MPSRTTTKSMSPGLARGLGHALVVLGGTQVHVVVEGEAQLEEQAALEDAGGNGGITDRHQEELTSWRLKWPCEGPRR